MRRALAIVILLLAAVPSVSLAFTLDAENTMLVREMNDPLKTVFDSYVPDSFIAFTPAYFSAVRRFDDTILVLPKHLNPKDSGNILYVVLEPGWKASQIARVSFVESPVGNDPLLRNIRDIAAFDPDGNPVPINESTSVFSCFVDEETNSRILEYHCLDVRFAGNLVLNRVLIARFARIGTPSLGRCDMGDPKDLIKEISAPGKTLVCGYVAQGGVSTQTPEPGAYPEAGPPDIPALPGLPELPDLSFPPKGTR